MYVIFNWGVENYGVYRHFQQYFSYIVAVSVIGGENLSTRRNHRHVPSHWQTLYYYL